MFLRIALYWVGTTSYAAATRLFSGMTPTRTGIGRFGGTQILTELTLSLIAGFTIIVLRFALANHRSADRVAGRVWKQVLLMAAFVTAGVITLAVVQALRR